MDDDFLAQAEALLLDAALDPPAWESALDFISKASSSAGIVVLSLEQRGAPLWTTPSLEDVSAVYMRDGWYQRDHRFTGTALFHARGIIAEQDYVTEEEMRTLPYYQEFLRPFGLSWSASIKVQAGDDVWSLNLQRSLATGRFEAFEQRRLLQLGRILSRAASLAQRLDLTRLTSGLDAVTAVGGACLMIDRHGQVKAMNAAAEAMLGKRFTVQRGQIAFAGSPSAVLQDHIEATLSDEVSPASFALSPVAVRPPGLRPLVFRAIRLKGIGQHLFSPARGLLLVTDLNETALAPAERIRGIFQLTPAEARLAHALTQVFGLVEAAQQLGISHETARAQIKALFTKTETRNQAELVALLARLGLA